MPQQWGDGMVGLFGVCVAAAIVELLLPGEGNGGTRALLRLLVVLTVLVLILLPLFSFLQDANPEDVAGLFEEEEGELAYYEDVFYSTVTNGSAADLSLGISGWLTREYGVSRENARVLVELDGEGALWRVSVYLSGEALLIDPQMIEDALEEKLLCEVTVR